VGDEAASSCQIACAAAESAPSPVYKLSKVQKDRPLYPAAATHAALAATERWSSNQTWCRSSFVRLVYSNQALALTVSYLLRLTKLKMDYKCVFRTGNNNCVRVNIISYGKSHSIPDVPSKVAGKRWYWTSAPLVIFSVAKSLQAWAVESLGYCGGCTMRHVLLSLLPAGLGLVHLQLYLPSPSQQRKQETK
jgi:hypothetical protein